MTLGNFASIAALLGIGGAVGALAAAISAAAQTSAAFEGFKVVFRRYMADRHDGPSLELDAAFSELDDDIAQFSSTFDRLKRALTRRK